MVKHAYPDTTLSARAVRNFRQKYAEGGRLYAFGKVQSIAVKSIQYAKHKIPPLYVGF